MAIILSENFSSPMHDAGNGSTTIDWRWGGDSISTRRRWFSNLVPYVETPSITSTAQHPARQTYSVEVGNTQQQAQRLYYFGSAIGNLATLNVYHKSGSIITMGICFQFMLYDWRHVTFYSTHRRCFLEFSFRSMLENSTTEKENFRIRITPEIVSMQSAEITFTTLGTGYPAISPVTVYRDLANQPLWFWAQCDMVEAETQRGNARVWIGDDLVAAKEDIYTGDVDSWGAQPWYSKNNRCVITFQSNTYSSSYPRSAYVYGLAATNEDLGYMDASLGDIGMATLQPTAQDSALQWEPTQEGALLEEENADVLAENTVLDLSALDGLKHVRSSDHMARDTHEHQHPFHVQTHIMAVCHSITHRKTSPPGDTSKYRIEPIYLGPGRPVEMDRSKGQVAETYPKVLQAFYTIPYAGAFWNEEILGLSRFGYALYDYALPEYVPDGLDLLGEYDVENLDSDCDFADEATVGDTP